MLTDTLAADLLEARKARRSEQAAFLSTLLAEIVRIGKDDGNRATTDEEAVKVIRKFLKNVDEMLALARDEGARERARGERVWLEGYLPAGLDEATLRAHVAELVAALPARSPKAMGGLMKALRERLGPGFDAAQASALVRQALA